MEKRVLSSIGIYKILSPDQSSVYINWKDGVTVITATSPPDISNNNKEE